MQMEWYSLYKEDYRRYQEYRQDSFALMTLLAEQGLWALLQYRVASAIYRGRLPPLLKGPLIVLMNVWRKIIELLAGISIAHQARIGPGLMLGHFGNIFIGGEVVIGEGCNVAQGVTLGISGRGAQRGMPTLGNRVFVGVNAMVGGKIVIGDDVAISACSLVIGNIPSGSVVIGVPGRIVAASGSEPFIRPQQATQDHLAGIRQPTEAAE
jgi:serine O-acetyltransferase